jgi:hypothetical protein
LIFDAEDRAGGQAVFLEKRLVASTVYFDFAGAGVLGLDVNKVLGPIAVEVCESPDSIVFWREDGTGGENPFLVRHDREVKWSGCQEAVGGCEKLESRRREYRFIPSDPEGITTK